MKANKKVILGVLVLVIIGVAVVGLNVLLEKPSPQDVQSQELKEFDLVAKEVNWELAPGKMIKAWADNSQLPGPELRVKEGDKVRVTFKNELPVATAIHWHGVDVPNAMDGVPGMTQEAVQPGETFIYDFIAKPAGTHFYHTHGSGNGDEATQMDMGLSGSFIIEPREEKAKYDREYTVILDDWIVPTSGTEMATPSSPHEAHQAPQESQEAMTPGEMGEAYNTFTINGKAFPATQPLMVKQGERVRLRLINISSMSFHPMHLHGHQFKVAATDGNPVPEAAQLTKNTITVMPGESYDIEFMANNPGTWLFHCHELHHADLGMVTLIRYEP